MPARTPSPAPQPQPPVEEMSRHGVLGAWCRRYLSLNALVIAGALAYVLFLNDNSILNHYDYERRISALREEIRLDTDSLEHYRRLNERLDTDRPTMERIVREQYLMQRPAEDVFIVTPR